MIWYWPLQVARANVRTVSGPIEQLFLLADAVVWTEGTLDYLEKRP